MKTQTLVLLGALALGSATGCDKGPAQAANMSATKPVTAVAAATLGGGVKVTVATPIDKLLANPSSFKGQTVRVEGMITDVCPKRGCWMALAGDQPGQKLTFKVTDGEMVFPMDSKGKWAVAEGVVSVRELTLEQTRAQAEEEASEYGKPFDPASITAPKVSVRIDGTGAQIFDRKI